MFTDADGEHDMVLAIRKISDKYCVLVISDNWPSMHGYNVLLMEQ